MNPIEVEVAIAALHSSGDFKVLRRLDLRQDHRFTHKPAPGSRIALCVDTETTGLDHTVDQVIELGLVAFEYDPDTGGIIRVSDRYAGFEDPGRPLPPEIIEITGITDEMVAGRSFDNERVAAMALDASLVIAHNAGFDRKFVEARLPFFSRIPWACTVSQLDWAAERVASRSLEFLLYRCCGFCINAHRALDDAEGVLGLLLGHLPLSGRPVFRTLLETSAAPTARICAAGAPFDRKELLKQRGYRWNDGARGSKGWWIDVPLDREDDELAYLASQVYPCGNTSSVEIKRIDALARFSTREP